MRLTTYTDYALRMMMFVAIKGEQLTTIEEVAKSYGISRNHLMKVAQALGAAGFLATVRGRGGGLRLGRPAHLITIGEIARVTEEDMTIVPCFAGSKNDCAITVTCTLKHKLEDALDAFMVVLDQTTLADVCKSSLPLLPRSFAQSAE
ncbi:RrF2 family transcriptional regulator [Lacibacterium aquatile]|uniref:RrF2 family transcriptional regulator n=1 Tax=Lacibacterium aquatile TaxID=1168082 RepID=A0ABW5DSY3_9PROT